MRKKLILHVGCEKTGTKSIQKALAKGREQLAENGIIYPRSLGDENHTKLIVATQDDCVLDNIRAHRLAYEGVSLSTFRHRLANQFRHELRECGSWHTLVVSTELIHSRLISPSEIDRLFEFFEEYVSDIEVILYLRRQDDLAISRFSTVLRKGHKGFNDVFGNIGGYAYHHLSKGQIIDDFKNYYNYRALIERFNDHVNSRNINIILYPDMLTNKCSVGIFSEMAGLDPKFTMANDETMNTAMSAQAQYVISKVNQVVNHSYSSGLLRTDVKELHRRIEIEMSGEKRKVSRDEAESFIQMFSDTNEWVRKTYFPERPQLFEMEFSQYPEVVDYSHFPRVLEEKVNYYVSQADSLRKAESLMERIRRSARKIKLNFKARNYVSNQ